MFSTSQKTQRDQPKNVSDFGERSLGKKLATVHVVFYGTELRFSTTVDRKTNAAIPISVSALPLLLV
ncbi:hypothetical protein [Myxacorys almedinensis]|uniref:Uncharacterized protein n=1 Tax=Myxacorys almedinensis A TaxID=2690445 RepID=A0A8J7Z2C5_9CYAN|nr:hypothetical protein [Myxacorys almedinensis]NDJ18757.1 hypothetical protein [Myxacorys almedinensis A]